MSKTTTRTLATLAATAALMGTAGATLTTPHADAATTSKAGWTVVATQSNRGGTQILEKVSPTGAHQAVQTIGANETLLDVSNDGRRALTGYYLSTDPVYRIYDLSTHAVKKFSAGNLYNVRFTNPSGIALLAQTGSETSRTGYWNVIKLGFDGRVQAEFTGTSGGDFLPSLDGRYLYAKDAQQRVTVSDNASGRKLRTFATPTGYVSCWPNRNLTATTFTASCFRRDGATQVLRFSAAGGTPVSLTSRLTPRQYGYSAYIPTAAGTVVQEAAGPGLIDKVSGTRTIRYAFQKSGDVLDVVGTRAIMQGKYERGQNNTLFSASLSTGKVITLFKAPTGRHLSAIDIIDPTK